MSASMKWRYLGHLQLLSKAVTAMAAMEVSPQEEMANPQGMKVFAVERLGLPEDFVSFPALCGVQPSPLVFRPLPILLFFCVFSAPFLGRALLQGGISARNICLFRADPLPLLLAKMCQLFLFLFCPLDFCSLCGFCSLCAPDTTFSALCTALMAGRGFHSVHNFTVHVLGV